MLARTMNVKQHLWLSHVKAADASDGSIADYAQAHGLRLKTLYQWKSKLVKLGLYQHDTEPTKSAFVPVAPVESSVSLPSCTIKLTTGTVIEFTGVLDAKTIRSIITRGSAEQPPFLTILRYFSQNACFR